VAVEGDRHRQAVMLARVLEAHPQQTLVAQMDSIEHSDRDTDSLSVVVKFAGPRNDLHER
jgi:hypothetical protein